MEYPWECCQYDLMALDSGDSIWSNQKFQEETAWGDGSNISPVCIANEDHFVAIVLKEDKENNKLA